MDGGVIIVVAVLFGCLVVAVLLLASRSSRRERCPQCGRVQVPGRASCPFCSAPYPAEPTTTTVDRSPSPPPGQAPQLVSAQGPYQGKSFPVSSSEFSIGRGSDSRLPLEGVLVSRQHALIIARDDGQYLLHDRESTNGTWVNGQRIAQHALQPGDQIQIGPHVLVFQMPGAQVSPGPITQPPERMPTPEPVRAGTVDLTDYDWPVDTIGGGGMSTVYLGISRRDRTPVAIKVFHQSYDEYLRGKFFQEITIGGTLSNPPHPHIARVLAGGTDGTTAYIIMEYVDNRSLRERLQPGQPMGLEHVTTIVGQTCDALHYAHSKLIYHRDIKPENILFTSQGGVKLVDFGIAKLATETQLTIDGMIIGTPYYMSYEQADGGKADGRSDIYSLGVVLYEMLTGRPPFMGEAVAVVHKHLTEAPVKPRRLNPSIPAQVENLVMRALAKRADKRFQTVEEMARALGYREPFHAPAPGQAAQPPAPGQAVPAPAHTPGPPTEPRMVYTTGQLVSSSRKTLVLGANITLIGRQNVDPEDQMISSEHARIRQHGGLFWLEDMGSLNGTYLNEQRIFEPAPLADRDMIRVGRTNLRIDLPRQ